MINTVTRRAMKTYYKQFFKLTSNFHLVCPITNYSCSLLERLKTEHAYALRCQKSSLKLDCMSYFWDKNKDSIFQKMPLNKVKTKTMLILFSIFSSMARFCKKLKSAKVTSSLMSCSWRDSPYKSHLRTLFLFCNDAKSQYLY